MRIAVTGTPGTGKTTATRLLEERSGLEADTDLEVDAEMNVEVVHLNDILEREGLYTDVDTERESKVADLEALGDWLERYEASSQCESLDSMADTRGQAQGVDGSVVQADHDQDVDGEAIQSAPDHEILVVESHLSHHLPADRCVVLRCAPETLETRLRERGESGAKAVENAESEALDVILSEAVDRHGLEAVYEVETTNRKPSEVATAIAAVATGEREPSAGTVDFVGYLA